MRRSVSIGTRTALPRAPGVEGALCRRAKQRAGVVGAQIPCLHDREELAQGGSGVDGRRGGLWPFARLQHRRTHDLQRIASYM